ncbi:MAG TPA: hypothetical protein PK360_02005, partial [bacterium]|nr:hypothetical protein [bacterium]
LPFVPIQLANADLDGDGVDELAISHTQPNGVSVFSFAGNGLRQVIAWDLDETFHGNTPMAMVIDVLADGFRPAPAVCTISGGIDLLREEAGIPFKSLGARVTDWVMTGMTGGDYDHDGNPELLLAGLDLRTEQPSLMLLCGESPGVYSPSPPVPIVRVFPLQQSFSVSTIPLNGDALPDLTLIDRATHQLVFFINRTWIESP